MFWERKYIEILLKQMLPCKDVNPWVLFCKSFGLAILLNQASFPYGSHGRPCLLFSTVLLRVEDFFSPAVQTVCGYRMLWMGTAFTSTVREAKCLKVSFPIPVALGTVLNFMHSNNWLCLTSVVASPLVIPCSPHPNGYFKLWSVYEKSNVHFLWLKTIALRARDTCESLSHLRWFSLWLTSCRLSGVTVCNLSLTYLNDCRRLISLVSEIKYMDLFTFMA